MAKAKKDLVASLKELGVKADPKAKVADLEKQLKKAEKAKAKTEAKLEPAAEGDDESRLEPPSEELPPEGGEIDYLRQYQVRKGTIKGSVQSDPQPKSRAEVMKAHLLKQPKVRIFVPRGATESKSIPASVCLNGYRLEFPKQAYLDMPQQVAELMMESLSQTEAAILKGQISGDKGKENALK